MKIKSLHLKNFRQFKDEKIKFSLDDDKNVTLINGNNGTGKSTFLQSFFWCFYGKTDFKNKYHLNTEVKHALKEGESAEVVVEVELIYVGDHYIIETKQEYYKRLANEEPERKNIERNIYMKSKEDGNLSKIDPIYVDSKINEIMPEKISRYFFFDGEDISSLGKEFSSSKKSKSFEEAVAGLLGHRPFQIAIEILNPNAPKHSVIGNYDSKLKKSDNNELKNIDRKLSKLNIEIDNLLEKNDLYNLELAETKKRRSNKLYEIKKTTEGKKLQEEKEKYVENIKKNLDVIENQLREASKNLSRDGWIYFAEPLIEDVIDKLDENICIKENLPEIDWSIIEHIISNEKCICGRVLDDDSRNHLYGLEEYLPPQSSGLAIKNFKKSSYTYFKEYKDLYEQFKKTAEKIDDIKTENNMYIDKIRIIDGKLLEFKETEKLQKEYEDAKIREDALNRKKTEIESTIARKAQQKEDLEQVKKELNLKDKNNRKIEIQKTYAQKAYKYINNTYMELEKEKRKEFEKEINSFYNNEFFDEFSIEVDDKYRISIYNESTGTKEFVDASTGQSVAIVFSFISAILSIIQKEKQMEEKDGNVSFTEPLPLLMDAPISSFDKQRIEKFSTSMPKMAEQMIIFLKDTDGDEVRQYIKHKTGKEYSFDKRGVYETRILER